jgi:hypothetical protein
LRGAVGLMWMVHVATLLLLLFTSLIVLVKCDNTQTKSTRSLLALPVHARYPADENEDVDRPYDERILPADKILAERHGIKTRLKRRRGKLRKRVAQSVVPPNKHWKGPPLLDPWRNVGGHRMRKGWKFEDENNNGTIFVSLVVSVCVLTQTQNTRTIETQNAHTSLFMFHSNHVQSFRDERCPKTLSEIFSKARFPHRIFVGVVQQNNKEDVDCFNKYCIDAGDSCLAANVRVVQIEASKSRGVMVVRHIASTLFEGEQYFLQIDAHCLFTQGIVIFFRKFWFSRKSPQIGTKESLRI